MRTEHAFPTSVLRPPRMLKDLDLRRQAIAAVVFLALTIALVVAVRHETGAAYTYPLDDTYIHTALARNLIEHGTWGINPGEFANASTSPVWTVLVAIAGGSSGGAAHRWRSGSLPA